MFLVLFVLGSVNVIGGAVISIESFGCTSGNTCKCNENITIMCTISPYQHVLFWRRVGGQTIAQCSSTTCAGAGNEYHFDFDRTGGRSNLTFLPLRLDHQGAVFQCDEAGTDNAQFTPIVDVSVDENDFNIEQTNTNDGYVELSIHSIDCVSLPDNISYEWKISETGSLTDKAMNFETTFNRTQNKTNVVCANSENPNCGGNATSKVSSSILITNDTGTPYYVFVDVTHNGTFVKSFPIPGTYVMDVQNNNTDTTTQYVSTDTQRTSQPNQPTNTTVLHSTKDTATENNTDIIANDNLNNAMQKPFIFLTVGGCILILLIYSGVIHIILIYVNKKRRKNKQEEPSFTNIDIHAAGSQSTNM